MSNATQNCEFCGSPAHIWYACPKRPADWKPERLRKKSTAARKDVQSAELGDGGHKVSKERVERSRSNRRDSHDVTPAGTQAPPVDTLKAAEVTAAHLAPKRGRPRVHEDRKAYKAQKERERRAKQKAEKDRK